MLSHSCLMEDYSCSAVQFCVSRTYKIEINAVTLKSSAGTSTPPSIAATPVPALPPPIAVNSYPSVPAPPNGQPATETLYTNGVHAYQGTGIASYTDYSCILRFTNLLCSIHITLNISNNIHDFFFLLCCKLLTTCWLCYSSESCAGPPAASLYRHAALYR